MTKAHVLFCFSDHLFCKRHKPLLFLVQGFKRKIVKKKKKKKKKEDCYQGSIGGASLVVQWLRLHTVSGGRPNLIPDQGTRSQRLQLRLGTAK